MRSNVNVMRLALNIHAKVDDGAGSGNENAGTKAWRRDQNTCRQTRARADLASQTGTIEER